MGLRFGAKSSTTAPTWMIVFLGNPGVEYEHTRHNAGWLTADALCKSCGEKINRLKWSALTGFAQIGGQRVLLMKPQTYMNLSGDAVKPAADFYKIPPERIIAVCDDIALPPGKLRIRRSGSDGGHKGLRSITQRLGTQEYPRLKLGVGAPPHPDYDIIDWVVGRLSKAELETIIKAGETAVSALEEIIRNGVDSAMNKFN